MITQTRFRRPLHLGGKEICLHLSMWIVLAEQENVRSSQVRGYPARSLAEQKEKGISVL